MSFCFILVVICKKRVKSTYYAYKFDYKEKYDYTAKEDDEVFHYKSLIYWLDLSIFNYGI